MTCQSSLVKTLAFGLGVVLLVGFVQGSTVPGKARVEAPVLSSVEASAGNATSSDLEEPKVEQRLFGLVGSVFDKVGSNLQNALNPVAPAPEPVVESAPAPQPAPEEKVQNGITGSSQSLTGTGTGENDARVSFPNIPGLDILTGLIRTAVELFTSVGLIRTAVGLFTSVIGLVSSLLAGII